MSRWPLWCCLVPLAGCAPAAREAMVRDHFRAEFSCPDVIVDGPRVRGCGMIADYSCSNRADGKRPYRQGESRTPAEVVGDAVEGLGTAASDPGTCSLSRVRPDPLAPPGLTR